MTPNLPVELTAKLRNYGTEDAQGVRLAVKIDGKEKNEFTRVAENIPAGGKDPTVVKVYVTFSPEDLPPLPEGAKKDDQSVLKQVTIEISQRDHLPADNARHTYLELRPFLTVLLVDPDHKDSRLDVDSDYLDRALTGSSKTNLKSKKVLPSEIKRENLGQYPVVFILNVPGVGTQPSDLDEESLSALENYAKRGGSVVFFLGPRTNVGNFNEHLYKNGQGIFPVKLIARPGTVYADSQVTTKEIGPDDDADRYPKVRLMKPDYPAFRVFGGDLAITLELLTINRYFLVDPSWKPGPNAAVLAQVANRQPLDTYVQLASLVIGSVNRERQRVADRGIGARLLDHHDRLVKAIANAPTKGPMKGALIKAVGGLVDDPALATYWTGGNDAERAAREELLNNARTLHQQLITGDPLIIEAAVGSEKVKGNVLVFTSPAGPTSIQGKDYKWNNWGDEMYLTYVPMLLDLQKHMTKLSRQAGAVAVDLLLTPEIELRLDANRYEERAELWLYREGEPLPAKLAEKVKLPGGAATPEPPMPPKPNGVIGSDAPLEDIKTFTRDKDDWVGKLKPPPGPGFYLLLLNPDGKKGPPELRPVAFNLENEEESALPRAAEFQLQEQMVHSMTRQKQFKWDDARTKAFVEGRKWFTSEAAVVRQATEDENKSWSEYSWVLLLFIVLLLAEQWLATHLSFHLRGGEAAMPAMIRPRRVNAPVQEPSSTVRRDEPVSSGAEQGLELMD